MNDRRTPNEIKEQAIMCFKQMARDKYDEGQAKAELKGDYPNLDDRPDLIKQARFEVLDMWFYLDSLAHQLDQLESEVDMYKRRSKR